MQGQKQQPQKAEPRADDTKPAPIVQGLNVKMAPIMETAQVVIVLALLPFILLCLLILEPFDHIRFRLPRLPRVRMVRQDTPRAHQALEEELA